MDVKLAIVVPTIRETCMEEFRKKWDSLFRLHKATLVTVWDGEIPSISVKDYGTDEPESERIPAREYTHGMVDQLFCNFTDAVRNYGFVYCARRDFTHILTLDDDVSPCDTDDPIQDHVDALNQSVTTRWMNTAHTKWDKGLFLRGVPYDIRSETPVMLSHGVWVQVPDFDGETQLTLENTTGIPTYLDYYEGPVPKGVLFPLCGMNVMIRREALPYFYFAPMGKASGFPDIHRFADIWMGIFLKQEFDRRDWACYTGGATVIHERASNAQKNFEQEKVGREINEHIWKHGGDYYHPYIPAYHAKRWAYHDSIQRILDGKASGPR